MHQHVPANEADTMELPRSSSPPTETLLPRVTLLVESYGRTDKGRIRDNNEDNFLIAELRRALQVKQTSLPQPPLQLGNDQGHLFIVADGMGGHAGGEHASSLVIRSVEEHALDCLKLFLALRDGDDEGSLVNEMKAAILEADQRVLAEAEKRPELKGMGSTITMGFYFNGELFISHVGDSRCYLFRDQRLYKLTHDHTLVAELVRRGALAPEAVKTHRLRHVINNVVGGPARGIHVEIVKVKVEDGDRYVLCSDGLSEMVADEEIARILARHDAIQPACDELIETALTNGGKDNVTAIVVGFHYPKVTH